MAQVRVGLVGLGQRGLQHLACLWQIPEARITALCDPYPDNLQEDKIRKFVDGFAIDKIRTHTTFDEMLRAGGLDAVYFSIPPNLHQGEVVRSAAAGLHLFVEKPVSLFLDEALEMERAIRSAGIISTVGFNQRHDAWHAVVKEFLADKRLVMMTSINNGALESHSVKHTHTEKTGGPANRVWAASMAWSGGTVVESGIHRLDLMRYWAGDVDWVEARYIHRDPEDIVHGGDNPYAYSATFGFASGMVANLIITRLRQTFYGDGYEDIVWDRGHLKIEGDGPVAYYYDGSPLEQRRPDRDALRHPLPVPPRNNNTLEISRAFVQAVAERDESPLRNTFASSVNSHAAVLGANISDRLGGKRLDLKELLESDEYAPYRRKVS
ncbi:MAG: Gfo/Idh/MocA family oxidoreductase [Acidobacteriota bacterium]